MANQLKMATVNAILALHQLNWSQRRIAREFGIDRETLGRYVHSPPADSKISHEPDPRGLGLSPRRSGRQNQPPARSPGPKRPDWRHRYPVPGPESLCEPFRAVIQEKLGQGLTGQRIYQELAVGHGFVALKLPSKRLTRQ